MGGVLEFTDGRCQVVPAYADGTSEASGGKQDAPPRHGKSVNARVVSPVGNACHSREDHMGGNNSEANSICVRHVATDEARANLLPTALPIGPRQPVPKGCMTSIRSVARLDC